MALASFWRCRLCFDANPKAASTCSTCKSKREKAQIAVEEGIAGRDLPSIPFNSIEFIQPATSADGRYIPASMRSRRTYVDRPPEVKPELKLPLDTTLLQAMLGQAQAAGSGAAGKASS